MDQQAQQYDGDTRLRDTEVSIMREHIQDTAGKDTTTTAEIGRAGPDEAAQRESAYAMSSNGVLETLALTSCELHARFGDSSRIVNWIVY